MNGKPPLPCVNCPHCFFADNALAMNLHGCKSANLIHRRTIYCGRPKNIAITSATSHGNAQGFPCSLLASLRASTVPVWVLLPALLARTPRNRAPGKSFGKYLPNPSLKLKSCWCPMVHFGHGPKRRSSLFLGP